jgi:hypothetical protein
MPKRLPRVGRVAVCVLAGLLLALAATPAVALHKESPGAYRITNGTSERHPPGRSWQNYFAFSSTDDLAGTGNTRREIFQFNMAFFDCFNGTTFPATPCQNPLPPFVQQLTNGAGDPDNPSLAQPFDKNADGVIDTQWLAFDALGTFNGSSGPTANHRQIFLKNLVSGEIRQVTFGTDGDSTEPSLSSLGGVLVFQSTARLTSNPTPPGIPQIFVYETNARTLRQVTNGAGPSTHALTNQSGSLVSFQSTADLLATLGETGISQIFYATYDKGTHTSQVHQVTRGNGASIHPYISDSSGVIVFESVATDLPSTLGGGGSNIYMTSDVADLTHPIRLTQLTEQANFGDCTWPVTDEGSALQQVKFICTGDPLANGTVGNRLFAIDLGTLTLFQITGSGDIQGPIGSNIGTWFVTMATTSDLTRQGSCGYQLFVVDYSPDDTHSPWQAATQRGQLPPDAIAPNGSSIIGVRTLEALPGNATVGSQVTIATPASSGTGGFSAGTKLRLVIGAPDEFTGKASIKVAQQNSSISPVSVPGFGALCMTLSTDGQGTIDCNGGDPGGDVTVSQDHSVNDTDPLCLPPDCREDDSSCQGNLPGPHRTLCPVCVGATPQNPNDGTCSSGLYAGQPCSTDEACQGSMNCRNGTVAACNGPIVADFTGTYATGGMLLTLPLTVSISRDPGADATFCTADDTYSAVKDVPVNLRLTSGTATGVISDADDVAGGALAAAETGVAFDCNKVRSGDLGGTKLVGSFPLLDIPNMPALHDLLISLRVLPAPPAAGSCGGTTSCASDLDCNDGNPCNGGESCISGVCVPGNPILCDDGDPCNGVETCDPTSGACVVGTPCDDGDPCNGTETCDGTGCHPGTPIVCSDNDACNGVEACNPADGTCQPGTPPNCDDNNVCTADSCDAALGCLHQPLGGACDDNNACTTGDACQGGVCTGTPVPCGDNDACNGVETCDPVTGICNPGVPPTCDDGNPCTDDACDPALGCIFTDNSLSCDDGSVCTTGDTCVGGVCAGTPVPCNDNDACNGVESCDPVAGCLPGTALDCDDNNPCTSDFCDPVLGCLHTPLSSGACDDGDLCTSGDSCVAGVCAGTPVVCSDGNICNGVELCNPADGTCQPGVPVSCDDGNLCTDDFCDAVLGCIYANNSNPCDDGSLCTTGDVCVAGVCAGTPLACDDGNACNGVELCNPFSGTCDPGVALNCDDGDVCTNDSCDPLAGCLHVVDPSICAGNLVLQLSRVTPLRGRLAQLRVRLSVIKGRIDKAKANPATARKNYARAYKNLVKFERALQKGIARYNFDLTATNEMLGEVKELMAEVQRLMNASL